MTKDRRDQLIAKGQQGILKPGEIKELVEELTIYQGMACRLERCVHDLVKEAEGRI